MKGGVKWYLRCTVKTFLLVVAWSMLMWLFTGGRFVDIGENSRKSWEIVYYMLMGEVIFGFSTTLSFYRRDIPLAISMGVSRKSAFWGTCFYTGMNIVAAVILSTAAGLLAGAGKNTGIWIFFGVLCVVWASIFGTVFGVIWKAFGAAAAIICGVVIYILFMAGIVFAGLTVKQDKVLNMALNEGFFAIIAAVTVLVWCGILVLHYRTVRKITV